MLGAVDLEGFAIKVQRARQEEVGVFEHTAVDFKADDGLTTQL